MSVHINVCPECGEEETYNGNDPPMICPERRNIAACYERFEPVEYVPKTMLEMSLHYVKTLRGECDKVLDIYAEEGIRP